MSGDPVVCAVCGQLLPALYRTVNGRTLCVEVNHSTLDTMLSAPPARVEIGSRPLMKRGWQQLQGVPERG